MLEKILLIVTAVVIAMMAYKAKALTASASITAGCMMVLLGLCMGFKNMTVMIFSFAVLTVVDKFIKLKKNPIKDSVTKKTGARDFVQVIANGLSACIMALMYVLSKKELYITASVAAFAEAFTDSLASDVGIYSKTQPVDIVKMKKVERGTSGGVSILGCTAALCGAVLVALYDTTIRSFNLKNSISIIISSMLGMFIDSILGSTVQLKYRCVVCGKVTEKLEHCEKETEKIGGFKPFDNDIVNLVSNALTAVIACFMAR